jgi:DNA-binding response OmpR family regulator
MSGYAYDAAGGDGLTAGDAFVQKPFSMHDLAATVRVTLDSMQAPDDSPTSAVTPG